MDLFQFCCANTAPTLAYHNGADSYIKRIAFAYMHTYRVASRKFIRRGATEFNRLHAALKKKLYCVRLDSFEVIFECGVYWKKRLDL